MTCFIRYWGHDNVDRKLEVETVEQELKRKRFEEALVNFITKNLNIDSVIVYDP